MTQDSFRDWDHILINNLQAKLSIETFFKFIAMNFIGFLDALYRTHPLHFFRCSNNEINTSYKTIRKINRAELQTTDRYRYNKFDYNCSAIISAGSSINKGIGICRSKRRKN